MPHRRPWQAALAASSPDPAPAVQRASADDREGAMAAHALFPFRAPEGYLALADWTDPDDPILHQVLPRGAELEASPGFVDDAVGDLQHHPAPGLVRKYPGRALLVVTGACAVNCRFCFRRAYPYEELRGEGLEPALAALASDPTVREVILSGGDPLTLTDASLSRILDRLEAMPHVRRLRIHSRVPVVLPERVTDALLDRLSASRLSAWLVVHFNHPRELRESALLACRRFAAAGVPVLNQAVLLRGVNDDEDTLAELCEGLTDAGIKPYYLHQLDRVSGTAHFEVPEAEARTLVERVRARVTGIAMPAWVRDVAGATSKIPLALLALSLVACGDDPPEPKRTGLSGVSAADVTTPTPTPRPTPSTPNADLEPLPSVDRLLVADLNGTGTPIVFQGSGRQIRWGHWPDEAPEPIQTGHYEGRGLLQAWFAHDLDGDGMDEVVASFGVGRGAVAAPLDLVLVERSGKAVFARTIWSNKGERNQAASLAPWPRGDGTFDVYAAAYTTRFDVGGAVISRDGGLIGWQDGHAVRMGAARAVADFDGDGRVEVAVGRMYGADADTPGDLRVIQDDGTVEPVPTVRGVRAVGAADLDGDGKAELLFGDGWHKAYGKKARYRPSVARRGADGTWAVELIVESATQYAVESIGATGGRVVAAGNQEVAVYAKGPDGWTAVGAPVKSSSMGAWAALRDGVFAVGGSKPGRFKR